MKKIVFILFLIIFIIFLFKLNGIEFTELINGNGKEYAKAKVVQIVKDNLIEDGTRVGQQEVVVEVLSGKYKGEKLSAKSNSAYLYGADCKVGMKVMVSIDAYNDIKIVNVSGYYRAMPIYMIIGMFFLSLYVIGGKKGIFSIIGLIFTFLMIFFLFLPLVYRGVSPFLASVLTATIITIVTLYFIGGYSNKTISSIIGTVSGVILSGIFAFLFCKMTDISGYNVSEIDELMFISQSTKIKPGELLFSGILISSLGAVMDVAMSIASAIEEIYRQNNKLSRKELFKSGMNVGKDAMGTMSNTLILAFVGTSINMVVTIYAYNYSYLYIINLLKIGIEIIQGVAGSMAIIYTVPIVSFVSSFLYSRLKK